MSDAHCNVDLYSSATARSATRGHQSYWVSANVVSWARLPGASRLFLEQKTAPESSIITISAHCLTSIGAIKTLRQVTRTATVIGKYPYPLTHPYDGIVIWAVCGFRQCCAGLCASRSGSTLRYLAGRPNTGFVIDVLDGVRSDPASGSCDRPRCARKKQTHSAFSP